MSLYLLSGKCPLQCLLFIYVLCQPGYLEAHSTSVGSNRLSRCLSSLRSTSLSPAFLPELLSLPFSPSSFSRPPWFYHCFFLAEQNLACLITNTVLHLLHVFWGWCPGILSQLGRPSSPPFIITETTQKIRSDNTISDMLFFQSVPFQRPLTIQKNRDGQWETKLPFGQLTLYMTDLPTKVPLSPPL